MPAAAPPSAVFAVGLRRAVVGLFLAGGLQVALMLPFSAASHPTWWIVGVAPALLAVLAALGRRAWTAPAARTAAGWLPALCGTALLLSLTASAALAGTATAASNAAVPLIQLGAFASGLATSRPAWAAAVVMVGLHRLGLVLAGTGTVAEHLTSSTWEVSALLASALGGAGCRHLARRVDDAAAELARSREADAALQARHRSAHRRARHLHDVALNRLLALTRPGQHDTPELRHQCATAATAILAGAQPLPGPSGDGSSGDGQSGDGSVRETVDAAAARAGVSVTVCGHTGPRAPAPVLDALAGAVDSALTNVARHSGRTHARIEIERDAGGWSVTVRDDGVGFDPAAVPPDRLGLRRAVVDRFAGVGGAGTVASRPGHGTAVTLTWPRPAETAVAMPEPVRRWRALGELMWTPILLGIGVITAVNLAVLLGHWDRYRSPWLAVALLAAMVAVALAIWRAAPRGLGPAATVAATASAVGGSAVASGLLPAGPDVVGPANWVAGFQSLAMVLLPFSRPAAEVGVAACAVLVANMVLMADPAQPDLAALTCGSAPAITLGATMLVAGLRTSVLAGDRFREQAQTGAELRAAQVSAADELSTRSGAAERDAADFLHGVSLGNRPVGEPGTRAGARRLHARLRADLRRRLEQSLLQALLLDDIDAADRTQRVLNVEDPGNRAARLAAADRAGLVGAVRSVAAGSAAVLVSVDAGLTRSGDVHVVIRAAGAGPPTGQAWARIATRPGARLTIGDGRWFLDVELPGQATP